MAPAFYAGVGGASHFFGRANSSVFQRSVAEAETVRGSPRPRLIADCWLRFGLGRGRLLIHYPGMECRGY